MTTDKPSYPLLAEKISQLLKHADVSWKLEGGKIINPTSDDVRKTLDKAYAVLYDGAIGDLVKVAGMIIYKTESGYEIFVSAGTTKEK